MSKAEQIKKITEEHKKHTDDKDRQFLMDESIGRSVKGVITVADSGGLNITPGKIHYENVPKLIEWLERWYK